MKKSGILAIGDDGVYMMIDGSTYQGRKRYLKMEKKMADCLCRCSLKWYSAHTT